MPLIRSRTLRSLAVAASLAGVAVGAGSAVAAPVYSPVTIVQNIPDATMGGFTPDGSELWVAQNRNNQVAIIDTATNTVKRTIAVSGNHQPETVVADPKGRFMLVVGYSGGLVWKIDTATYQVLQTYPINDSVWNIAIKPDGSGFYAPSWVYGGSKIVQYVDIATGATTTINIPSRPDGLAPINALMSRDGSRVYITGPGFGSPKVQGYFTIDTATNTVVDADAYPVPASSWNFGYASQLDSATGKLYLIDEDSGDIFVIDTATGTKVATLSSPGAGSGGGNSDTFLLALNPTGTLLAQIVPFFGTSDLTLIDPSTGATQHTFTAPAGGVYANGVPWGVTFSPNGCRLYTFNARGSTRGSVSVFGVPCPPAAPPDLVVTAGDGSLKISYTTPDDNGSAITDYEYSLDGGTTWKSASTTGTSFTIPGLTNGTEYSVKVRAKNYYGPGQPSTASTARPTAAASNSQAAAEDNPKITIPAASVSSGATLTSTVSPSVAGTVKVTATLAGRTVCTATKKATRAGRMTVTCNLTKGAKAVISKKAVTLKVTARLTDAKGKTATASRNVKVARYVVKVPVTG